MADSAIREMQRADLPEVLDIIRAHSRDDARLAQRYFRRYFADAERLSSPGESSAVFVIAGTVAGLVTYGPDKYEWPGILWLEWLYVAPQQRGNGVGTALVRHVLARARELGARKVYLNTDSTPGYEAAIRLYTHLGFVTEGRLLDYYERGHHCILMGLEI